MLPDITAQNFSIATISGFWALKNRLGGGWGYFTYNRTMLIRKAVRYPFRSPERQPSAEGEEDVKLDTRM